MSKVLKAKHETDKEFSEDFKERMSKMWKDVPKSAEQRQKMSEASKDVPKSAEHKEQMSTAHSKRYNIVRCIRNFESGSEMMDHATAIKILSDNREFYTEKYGDYPVQAPIPKRILSSAEMRVNNEKQAQLLFHVMDEFKCGRAEAKEKLRNKNDRAALRARYKGLPDLPRPPNVRTK